MDVKEQIRAIKDDEGRLTVDRSEIADILSNQFESVFCEEVIGTSAGFLKKNWCQLWDRASAKQDKRE